MKYPYVTMIKKYKDQLILEVCNEFNNFRVIIQKDNLFDTTIILKQKYAQTEKQKILSIYDLHKFNYIDFDTNIQLLKEINIFEKF